MLLFLKRLIPPFLFRKLQAPYHRMLALLGALLYRFPSRSIFVLGVTGTKGKSSTVELVSAILEEAGYATALASTIRFKIADSEERNLFKMTMPGRFFLQRFLRAAVDAGCDYVILEMTSEGVLQSRHRYIYLDALILTNITPEHIDAHGSYENYVAAKLRLRDLLELSPKQKKWMIVNQESAHADAFLEIGNAEKVAYERADAEPYHVREGGIDLTLSGIYIHSPLLGGGNLENIVAAATFARTQDIDTAVVKHAVEKCSGIPGRGERVDVGQSFTVIVDYAHTPESLKQLYQTFAHHSLICVLGSAGGGRDRAKRSAMGSLADTYCSDIILTDEDPYDENPRAIVEDMARGIRASTPSIIMDRRAAIREAVTRAESGSVVLITGKGTDPFIMGPRGSRIPWNDRAIAEEEIRKLRSSRKSV